MENDRIKYSDHTTVGGQVLAHRVRMMLQNWNVIWLVGRISFLVTFICYLFSQWRIRDVWNYLCIVKACYRNNMVSLPSALYSSSCFWFSGRPHWISDYVVAANKEFLMVKDKFGDFLCTDLKISICVGMGFTALMVLLNKCLGKSISDGKCLLSGRDYVDAKALKKAIKERSNITLAEVPYPRDAEFRHTIITGTTSAGKSNVMIELLDQIAGKNEVKLGWYSCTTITGLCETNVVMSTPEPETAKYMSNFLGEKEEISTNESISYGGSVTLHSKLRCASTFSPRCAKPCGAKARLQDHLAIFRNGCRW